MTVSPLYGRSPLRLSCLLGGVLAYQGNAHGTYPPPPVPSLLWLPSIPAGYPL